jgi:hypothetical protein
MHKFPIIVYIGAGLIAWTAGEMIVGDPKIKVYFTHILERLIPAVITILVIGGCWLYNLKGKTKQQKTSAPAKRAAAKSKTKKKK